jgi:ribosome-associated protein
LGKKVVRKKLLEVIIQAAESKKAENIVVLDVQKQKAICDYLIIASGGSAPQLRAIIKEIDLKVKKAGEVGRLFEGNINSGWVILDLGTIIVHVMSEEERAYYNLEELWGREAVFYHV